MQFECDLRDTPPGLNTSIVFQFVYSATKTKHCSCSVCWFVMSMTFSNGINCVCIDRSSCLHTLSFIACYIYIPLNVQLLTFLWQALCTWLLHAIIWFLKLEISLFGSGFVITGSCSWQLASLQGLFRRSLIICQSLRLPKHEHIVLYIIIIYTASYCVRLAGLYWVCVGLNSTVISCGQSHREMTSYPGMSSITLNIQSTSNIV